MEDGRRNESRAVLWNKTAQYSTPGTLFYPASSQYGPIRANYGEMMQRQVNKNIIEQPSYGSIDLENKDIRGFYKADTAGIVYTSPIRPGTGHIIVQNSSSNMQNLQNQQPQTSRIIPRYPRYQ